MKKIFALIVLLVAASASYAQVAISATITDSDTTAWIRAPWSAVLSSGGTAFTGVTDGNGVLSDSTHFISGNTYNVTVCPLASVPCQVISSVTISTSAAFQTAINGAITAPRFAAGNGSYGYANVEVSPAPSVGQQYYNVVSAQTLLYCGSWTFTTSCVGLPLTGGTLTGPLTFNGSAGTLRGVYAQTSGVNRWVWGASAIPENGGNTGSDWILNSYGDNGAAGITAMDVSRATGQVIFGTRPEFGTGTPWDSINLNFAAPPAIGGANPNSGNFTTLSATSEDSTPIGLNVPEAGGFTNISLTNNIAIACTAGFGGVTANTLVVYGSGSSSCFPAGIGASNTLGVALNSAAVGGTVMVAEFGYVNAGCVADNNWTTGDLLVVGTTTAPHCKDFGTNANSAIPSTTQIVGRAMSACTAGSTCPLFTAGIGHFGTGNTLYYTATLGGSLLSIGCTNQSTVPVSGATTSMACVMSGVGGNPANIQPQCSVTSSGTVTPQLCTSVAVTPSSQTYAVRVVP